MKNGNKYPKALPVYHFQKKKKKNRVGEVVSDRSEPTVLLDLYRRFMGEKFYKLPHVKY